MAPRTGNVTVTMPVEMLQTIIDGLHYASELAERTEDPDWSDSDHEEVGEAMLALHNAAEVGHDADVVNAIIDMPHDDAMEVFARLHAYLFAGELPGDCLHGE